MLLATTAGCAAFVPPAPSSEVSSGAVTGLELNSDDPQSLYRLGNRLAEQGRLQAAQRAYNRALALDPAMSMARYNLGLVHLQLGWQAVIESTPGLPEPDRAALGAALYLQCITETLKGNPDPRVCRSPQSRESTND
jgi:tetratricopeptide (TPR) repeat protein